jgi:hypothetical protein
MTPTSFPALVARNISNSFPLSYNMSRVAPVAWLLSPRSGVCSSPSELPFLAFSLYDSFNFVFHRYYLICTRNIYTSNLLNSIPFWIISECPLYQISLLESITFDSHISVLAAPQLEYIRVALPFMYQLHPTLTFVHTSKSPSTPR